jgi:tetratricopeptide (TPR) repeat protein
MGLLDWLNSRIGSEDPLTRFARKHPEARQYLLHASCEVTAKQAENLRAVGREDDAFNVIKEHVGRVLAQFKNEPDNPQHLDLLTDVAIELGAPELAKLTLEPVIEGSQHFTLDLTSLYMDLGRVYQHLGADPKRELQCYEMAADAKAPDRCRFPATPQQKAKAHQLAYSVCQRLGDRDRASSHAKKARQFVPSVNWDDPEDVKKLMILTPAEGAGPSD